MFGWSFQTTFREVFETANDPTGNYGRGLIDITFAEPDLQVTDIDVPVSGASGSQIDVTYTVSNTGTRATRENVWYDRVFISVDGSLDRQDHMIGEFRREGSLDIGESYQETLKVDLPVGIEGDFTIFVETDSTSDEGFSFQVSTVLPGLLGLLLAGLLVGPNVLHVVSIESDAMELHSFPLHLH